MRVCLCVYDIYVVDISHNLLSFGLLLQDYKLVSVDLECEIGNKEKNQTLTIVRTSSNKVFPLLMPHSGRSHSSMKKMINLNYGI